MLVAEHLDFDVARIDDELFNENTVVAERGLGFSLREVEAFLDFDFECAMRMPLPPPPADALIITG
jgi:hypothetical protein